MSKTERRKLFQPIPLSSILDPTYKSPFSKLEKFQVDMDISSKFPQQSVWQKLQSSLLSAMSNFVIMTQPVFTSSTTSVMSHRSTPMSLVPWKSFKPCELLISEDIVDSMPKSTSLPATPIKSVPEKSASLYHSVRSGLQCLRYLATHPLQSGEGELKESVQTPTRHFYDCRKQSNNIVLPTVGFSIVGGGGALFFPLISSADCASRNSLSAPVSPTHHYQQQTWKPVVSNLFSWAMSGFLLATPLHHRHFHSLYKNYCLFSPIHTKGAEINTTMLCPQKSSGNVENLSSPCKAKAEGNIEIFIHSSLSATSHEVKSGKDLTINCTTSASPTKAVSVTSSPTKTNSPAAGNNSGCIRIETNWRAMNDESSSRTNFHTMSVCSSSTALKGGGTLTFSCSSVSSSPRTMMSAARAIPRRFKTESESSTDSFVEFSASVESTDSFCIVFESAPGGSVDDDDNNNSRNVDDDEDWEDDDDEDDDSDDDDDQIYNYSGTSDDIFVNGFIFEADEIDLGGPTSCDQVDLRVEQVNKQHKKKTVSFDEEHLEVIVEFEDDIESKSSRETYWEMLARDRSRFQDRILRTGDILESILQPAHRLQVYRQRFLEPEENQLQ